MTNFHVVPTMRRMQAAGDFVFKGLAVMALFGAVILTGCAGMISTAGNGVVAGNALSGNLHGGQQPIVGATVNLYAAQTAGYGQAGPNATVISTTTTDSLGNFNLPNFTCPASPNDMTFIVSIGGNSGSGTNTAAVMMAPLGACSNLGNIPYVFINEVTTIVSVYALQNFMADYHHVGSSSTNYAGFQAAFATANNLVDITTGQARSVTPAYGTLPSGASAATFNSVVPQAEINALANIISACVNSNGVGGSSTACSNLFTATKVGIRFPTNTFQAALYVAQNPGNNVSGIFNLAPLVSPFAPTLSSAPNDWSMAISFTGGGLGGSSVVSKSNALAVDGSNNIWIANAGTATVTELSNLGVPLSPTMTASGSVLGGFTAPSLISPSALAVDKSGNVWVSDSGSNLIAKLTNAGVAVGSGYSLGGNSTERSYGVAVDGSNNVWAAGKTIVAELNNSGTVVSGAPFKPASLSTPTGSIAIDASNNVWFENSGNGSVVELNSSGTQLGTSGNVLAAPTAFSAIDSSGKYFAPQAPAITGLNVFQTNAVAFANYTTSTVPSLLNATSVIVDGANHLFTAAAGSSFGNLTETTNAGVAISPSATGFINTNTVKLISPGGVGIDGAGNVWVVNGSNGASSVLEYVGLATPTITPLAASLSKIGQEP